MESNDTARFLITTGDKRTWQLKHPVLFQNKSITKMNDSKNLEEMDYIIAPPMYSDREERITAIASTAPAAPKRWPVIDFVELIFSLKASS